MRKNKGFSLLEKILVLVIAIGVAVGVYKIFRPSDVQAAVHQEQQNVGRLVDGIMGAYSTASNFSTLSTQTAAGVLNLSLQQNNTINSGMKTDLSIRPATSATPNDSFDITYAALSSEQCVKLIPALADRSSAVFVGSSGTSLQNARGDITNENLLAAQCNSAPTTSVTFRFRGEKHTFSANQLESCMCAPQSENQTLTCPSGTTGSITQRRTGVCTGGTPACPSLQWSSWTTTSNTCGANAQPVPPATPVAPGNLCVPLTEYRSASCASGEVGSILQQRSRSCATNTWSAWTEISRSCQAVSTPSTCQPATEPRTSPCPAGQGGQILEERTGSCAANGNRTWSDWKTISNSCTATCATNGSCCQVSRRPPQVQVQQCAIGSWGSVSITLQQSSRCPSPTGPAVWDASGWKELSRSGGCSACPANSVTQSTRWVERAGSCPAGQTGSLVYNIEQVQDIDTTYLCNSQAGMDNANPIVNQRNNWRDTGNTSLRTNTCQTVGTYQWVARGHSYGPGSGCNLGADQQRAEQLVQNGTLRRFGTAPYLSYEVVGSCSAANDGETIMVYSGCGDWQAGIEGYSGFRCEDVGEAPLTWVVEEYSIQNGRELWRGLNWADNPYIKDGSSLFPNPSVPCTTLGQTAQVTGYNQSTAPRTPGYFLTVVEATATMRCGYRSYPEF